MARILEMPFSVLWCPFHATNGLNYFCQTVLHSCTECREADLRTPSTAVCCCFCFHVSCTGERLLRSVFSSDISSSSS